MCFWKIFAWIALIWSLIARRGAGVLIRKKPAEGDEPQEQPPVDGGHGVDEGRIGLGDHVASLRRWPERIHGRLA